MSDEFSEANPRPRHLPLSWLVPLGLALAIYELTTRPDLAVALVSLKFGWEDYRTALWLRQRDPWPDRGRTCYWLYIGGAFYRIGMAALLMSGGCLVLLIMVLIFAGQQQPVKAIVLQYLSALLVVFVNFILATIAVSYALSRAWRRGPRLWLSASIHRARRSDSWPPLAQGAREHNELPAVLQYCFPMAFVGLMILLIAPIWFVIACFHPFLGDTAERIARLLPVAIFVFLYWRSRKLQYQYDPQQLLAATPSECWDTPTAEDEGAAPVDDVAADPGHPVP